MAGPSEQRAAASEIAADNADQAKLTQDDIVTRTEGNNVVVAEISPVSGKARDAEAVPPASDADTPPLITVHPVKILKRQRIEYEPVSLPTLAHSGGWDVDAIDETAANAVERRGKRKISDLGIVNVRSLTMCLRSRLRSEMTYALNALGLLTARSEGPAFRLVAHSDLLEELLELFSDLVYGEMDEVDLVRSSEPDLRSSANKDKAAYTSSSLKQSPSKGASAHAGRAASFQSKSTYEQAYHSGTASTSFLRQSTGNVAPDMGYNSNLALSCLAVFHNASFDDGSIEALSKESRLIEVALAMSEDEGIGDVNDKHRSRLRMTEFQRVQCRKETLQLLANVGPKLQLEQLPRSVAQSVIMLLDYFLRDQKLDTTGVQLDRGASIRAITPATDIAILTLAKIALSDANRDAISKVVDISKFIMAHYSVLLFLLPTIDMDYQSLATEVALVRAEMAATSLFNLIYIASQDVRRRLRERTPIIKILAKVARKLYMVQQQAANVAQASQNAPTPQQQFGVLCLRCIEILRLLSEGDAGDHQLSSTGSSEGKAWFGGSRDSESAGASNEALLHPSLLFCRPEFVEMLALPANDRALFSSLADCT